MTSVVGQTMTEVVGQTMALILGQTMVLVMGYKHNSAIWDFSHRITGHNKTKNDLLSWH